MQHLNRFTIFSLGALLLTPTLSLAANYKGEKTRPAPTYKAAATPTPVIPRIVLKDGPYVGVTAGYDSYKIHENYTISRGSLSSTHDTTSNSTGLVNSILGGYGHYFNNSLYVAAEVFLNLSQAYQNNNMIKSCGTDTVSYSNKFIAGPGYGFAILPGIKLNDGALIYGHLGYNIARLRGQENSLLDNNNNIASNSSSWSGGVAYGLGFEAAMVENFTLRGEYIHTDYRSFTDSAGTEFAPSDNQFNLGLLYHFF